MGILKRFRPGSREDVWLAESRLLHRLGYVRPPEAVQWISTSACELTCPHCYSKAGRRSRKELTTSEAKRFVVDELVRMERPVLVIAGGEPLLRHDFPAVVRYAASRKVPWALHSHGRRVETLSDLFRECPPVMAAISLDGPRAYHDRFRGRYGTFDAAMRAIRTLKRAGCPEVVVGTTIHRENADLLVDMLPDVMRCGADSWGFHLMTPEGRAGANRHLLPTPRQLRRVASYARRMRSVFPIELDNEWGSAGREDCFYRDTRFTCGAGRFTCVVSATGEVMPCTTTDPGESEGNVRDRPLSEIWRDGFGRYRRAGDPLRSDVRDCWLQTRHGISCRGAAFRSDPIEDGFPGSTALPATASKALS